MTAPITGAWAVLRLEPGASAAEIDRQFRLLARSAHPDAGGSAAQFRELTDAYATVQSAGSPARSTGATGSVTTHVTSIRGRWRRLVVGTRHLTHLRGGFS